MACPALRSPMEVVIIGAGATGCLIAQGLKKAGIDFRIVERYDPQDTAARRPRDWSMGLHWGREYLQAMLPESILNDLHLASTDYWAERLTAGEYEWACTEFQSSCFPVINGQSSDVIGWVKGTTSRRASRRKIIELFSRGLPIEYGKQLIRIGHIDGRVVCHFADGSTIVADAVVGADSVRSVVRSNLMPKTADKLETLPTVMYNFTQKYTAEQARFIRSHYHPVFKYSIHPTLKTAYILSVLDVPDPKDPESWTFQLMVDQWGHSNHFETSADRLAHLKSLASEFCEPFKSAALWVKEDTYIPADRPQHMPDLQPWNNFGGRVTLAGDAAHPMAPYRAQGLNQGICDAKEYVDAIKSAIAGETTLADAIAAYDQAVYHRGKEEILLSAHQGVCSHHYEKLMESPLMQKGLYKLETPPTQTGSSLPSVTTPTSSFTAVAS